LALLVGGTLVFRPFASLTALLALVVISLILLAIVVDTLDIRSADRSHPVGRLAGRRTGDRAVAGLSMPHRSHLRTTADRSG
jgi:hypothetical protein